MGKHREDGSSFPRNPNDLRGKITIMVLVLLKPAPTDNNTTL